MAHPARAVLTKALETCWVTPPKTPRLAFIPNTLEVAELYVTEPLAADFHQRVNAVDPSMLAKPPNPLSSFIGQLMIEPPTDELAASDWVEDQEFTPGEVVAIEPEMADWIEQYLVIVKREANWLLADNGEGWFYLLWKRDEQCYVRLLTQEQQAEVMRLGGLSSDADWSEEAPPPESPAIHDEPVRSNQGTLW